MLQLLLYIKPFCVKWSYSFPPGKCWDRTSNQAASFYSLSNYYSLMNPSFNSTQSDILTASLKKIMNSFTHSGNKRAVCKPQTD